VGGVFFDPNARGPDQLPTSIDYQEMSSYFEYAPRSWLSAFMEVPYRFVHFRNVINDEIGAGGFFPEPDHNGDENSEALNNSPNGFSDIQVGFKAALLAATDFHQYLTFQFRTYIPTGDSRQGLGTGHVSLEPGLLAYDQPTERLVFQGQLRDWIPIHGGPGDGNVLIYGVGASYDVYQRGNLRVVPVAEFVGWTVLSGFESIFGKVVATSVPPGTVLPLNHGVASAAGNTIVNAKLGVRTYFRRDQDIYIGYGQALTGDRWYKEIVRLEYRIGF
jgi:hypothetical protein